MKTYTPKEERRLWAWLEEKVEQMRREDALNNEPGTELPTEGPGPSNEE